MHDGVLCDYMNYLLDCWLHSPSLRAGLPAIHEPCWISPSVAADPKEKWSLVFVRLTTNPINGEGFSAVMH